MGIEAASAFNPNGRFSGWLLVISSRVKTSSGFVIAVHRQKYEVEQCWLRFPAANTVREDALTGLNPKGGLKIPVHTKLTPDDHGPPPIASLST